MQLKKTILAILGVFAALTVTAQANFLTEGKITFEKKYNQLRVLEEEDNDDGAEDPTWKAEIKKNFPKIVTTYYELQFTADKSVYKFKSAAESNKYIWGSKPNEDNILIKNLSQKTISSQVDVFEQTYLIKDSLNKLQWKILSETRNIAGFECRKAVTKICDSVVVVAFYTDQITVSNGPEGVHGLPGMILGLAVPRLATTWYATKVEVVSPTEAMLNTKQKGKLTDWKNLTSTLKKSISKEEEKWLSKYIWSIYL